MQTPTPTPGLQHCDREPIHLPGAIQPHGRMLVVAADGATLVAWSENWAGRDEAEAALVALALDAAALQPGEAPAALGTLAFADRKWDASAHRMGEHVFVEFERAAPDLGPQAPIYALARHVVPALQRARTIAELCALAVRELKRLTGFGRCLACRFDEEGHGEVLAEEADEGYDRYAGHRFPASDIPPQARALCRVNYIRLIPDANCEPVRLVAAAPGVAPAALDLSMAQLRSVSPAQLETMRNRGTLASMSVSIVAGGRLWGLVSCHDHAPHGLSFQVRGACEHLGRLLSLQVAAIEERAEVAKRLELRQLTLQIISQRADLDATLLGLASEPAPLLRMAQASGAAIVLDDELRTVGETPPPDAIRALARWIAHRGGESFATDRLPELYPEARAWRQLGAGVLALSISQVHRHLILWFRPAVVQAIRWAGEPGKSVREDGRIQPRRSFASWRELVEDRALPWSGAERAAALELRQSLIAIVLRHAEELAEVATELGRVNKELEAFSYTVSHDLRAPMRHISGYVDLVLEIDAATLSERARRYLSHVKDAATYSGRLVDGLLDFSRMGRAALKRTRVDTATLVADLVREFSRLEPAHAIEWEVVGELPALDADPLLIQLALRNLVANAVKYSREREPARIRIEAVRTADGDGVDVVDNGVGFDMKYVGKLFGVFQRLHQSDEFEGTGIGLASVRRIVERHGGTVRAEGRPDGGARFGFVLPRKKERPAC
jgi:light-regulated signal transduction histidine kinase (bacteriophytochrome)